MNYIRQEKTPFITGDGSQQRDMLHVDDAVSANIFAMNRKTDFAGSVYDVGTGKNVSLKEIRDVVKGLFPSVVFDYRPSRPNEVLSTKANTIPLKELGWEARTSIKDGLFRCFKKLREEI